MKKIKLFTVAAMLMIVGMLSAQTSFSVKGGLNLSNFVGEKATDVYKIKPGFHAGLGLDFEFMPSMALQTGLMFHTKGAKFKDTDKSSVDLMYLQLPVHFAYKVDFTPATRIVFHAGPYAAYGLSGNLNINGTKTDIFKDRTKDLPILGEVGIEVGIKGANRFDAGLGFGVGAEISSFLVDLGWDIGLMKLYKDGKRTNGNIMVSVGYKF